MTICLPKSPPRTVEDRRETDEILAIECENLDGDKTLHKARLGRKMKLKVPQ